MDTRAINRSRARHCVLWLRRIALDEDDQAGNQQGQSLEGQLSPGSLRASESLHPTLKQGIGGDSGDQPATSPTAVEKDGPSTLPTAKAGRRKPKRDSEERPAESATSIARLAQVPAQRGSSKERPRRAGSKGRLERAAPKSQRTSRFDSALGVHRSTRRLLMKGRSILSVTERALRRQRGAEQRDVGRFAFE